MPPGAARGEPSPYFEYHPPLRGPESKEDEEALLDFNLEALLELGLEVDCFLQGLAESFGEGGWEECPSQNPKWRSWKVG